MGVGSGCSLLSGISLVPGSQLSFLDRRAALWSGKNPLRFLKQSSRHNHLIVRVFMCWARLPPPPSTSGLAQVGLCLSGKPGKPGPCRQPQLVDDTLQTPQMISGDALSRAFCHKLIWPLLAHPSSQVTFTSLCLALPFSCPKSPVAPGALRMASRPTLMQLGQPATLSLTARAPWGSLGWNPCSAPSQQGTQPPKTPESSSVSDVKGPAVGGVLLRE